MVSIILTDRLLIWRRCQWLMNHRESIIDHTDIRWTKKVKQQIIYMHIVLVLMEQESKSVAKTKRK